MHVFHFFTPRKSCALLRRYLAMLNVFLVRIPVLRHAEKVPCHAQCILRQNTSLAPCWEGTLPCSMYSSSEYQSCALLRRYLAMLNVFLVRIPVLRPAEKVPCHAQCIPRQNTSLAPCWEGTLSCSMYSSSEYQSCALLRSYLAMLNVFLVRIPVLRPAEKVPCHAQCIPRQNTSLAPCWEGTLPCSMYSSSEYQSCALLRSYLAMLNVFLVRIPVLRPAEKVPCHAQCIPRQNTSLAPCWEATLPCSMYSSSEYQSCACWEGTLPCSMYSLSEYQSCALLRRYLAMLNVFLVRIPVLRPAEKVPRHAQCIPRQNTSLAPCWEATLPCSMYSSSEYQSCALLRSYLAMLNVFFVRIPFRQFILRVG